MDEWVQLQLERLEGESKVSTTVVVPYDKKAKRVKIGTQITLKGEEERWVVVGMSKPQKRPNRGWDIDI